MTEPAESVDIAAQVIDDCFFLRRRSADPADFAGAIPGAYRHVFTYWHSERTIRSALETMIAGAERKVFIASYLLGDASLLDALAAAAQRLLGGVYVITQLDDKRLADGLRDLADDGDERLEGGTIKAAVQAQKKRFDQMTRAGIYVRGHRDCHAKFAVIDDRIALVTSANLMTSALDTTGENGVVITEPAQVQRLARLFGRLWHTECSYEARPGEKYGLSSLKAAERWTAALPAPRNSGSAEIIWTDSGEQTYILDNLQAIIDSAQTELLLASFSLAKLRSHREELLDRICAAAERGVRVQLLLRPRRNRPDHLADAAELARAGVEVYGDPLTHVKAAIADRSRGALFSANFDFEHGLTSGVEVGCRLDGTPALGDATRYLQHAIDQAAVCYMARPSHRDLDQGLDARWRVPWPLGGHLTVTAAPEDQTSFARAAREWPVLFTIRSADALDLHTGHARWHLTRRAEDRYELTRKASQGGADSRRTLTRWLTDASAEPPRGFCAAVFEWAN
jgi:hypothetical protein